MYVYVAQSLFSLVARFVKTSTKVHEGLIKEMLDTEDNAESRPKQPSWALDYLLSKSIIFLPFPTRTGADESFILKSQFDSISCFRVQGEEGAVPRSHRHVHRQCLLCRVVARIELGIIEGGERGEMVHDLYIRNTAPALLLTSVGSMGNAHQLIIRSNSLL